MEIDYSYLNKYYLTVIIEGENEPELIKWYEEYYKDKNLEVKYMKSDDEETKEFREIIVVTNSFVNKGCKVIIQTKMDFIEKLMFKTGCKILKMFGTLDKRVIIK
jgi:hypothetical protein